MSNAEGSFEGDHELRLIREQIRVFANSLGHVATIKKIKPDEKKPDRWHIEGDLLEPFFSEGRSVARVICSASRRPGFEEQDRAMFMGLRLNKKMTLAVADFVSGYNDDEAGRLRLLENAVGRVSELEAIQKKTTRDQEDAAKHLNEADELKRIQVDLHIQAVNLKTQYDRDSKTLGPYREYINALAGDGDSAVRSPEERESAPLSNEVGSALLSTLIGRGLSSDFAVAYLLSLLTALANRRFLLIAGHVGVGKSHLVIESGKLLGGRKADLIAVRPGWLDPSDLLGYFDPLAGNGGTFRDSHFTEVLRGIGDGADRPRLVLLDEMNIARVENYAADLLAVLGSSEEKLTLYAGRKQSGLAQVAQKMLKDAPDNEYRDNLDRLLKAVDRGDLPIPKAAVFCGTLNVDGSTEELSPKMLDRSFLLRFPRPKLDEKSGKDEGGKATVPISVEEVQKLAEEARNAVNADPDKYKWSSFYAGIKGFEDCLIPLSRRVYDDYAVFMALGKTLWPEEEEDALQRAFAFARILPRVNFDPVIADRGKKEGDKPTVKLETWLKVLMKADAKDAIGEATRRLCEELGEPHVAYQRVCG